VIELVDLPGTYSLAGANPAEQEAQHFLLTQGVDLVINVVDASLLERSLELTLELLELGVPVVLALNMIDEAHRKGVTIDHAKLGTALGVPAVPLVARKGIGVRELFATALKWRGQPQPLNGPRYSRDVEAAVTEIAASLDHALPLPARLAAIKLLEGDPAVTTLLQARAPAACARIEQLQSALTTARGRPADLIIASERHATALNVFEANATVTRAAAFDWRDRLDDVLLHPVWGYVLLVAILFAFFEFVYRVGTLIEQPTLALFDGALAWLAAHLGATTLAYQLVGGVIHGVAIVLPYLVPFLIGLGVLEDVGYLPRVAFLVDGLMHRLGLHGKAVIPFILGYGCNVPAVMATRILEEPRDRLIAATLATMVPCAARLTVVFGLAAFYLGPIVALGVYALNLLVIAVTGAILTRLTPEVTPGLILEMPVYRVPTLRTVLAKGWWRVREFVTVAWPVLIGGSLVLSLLEFFHLDAWINTLLTPLTWALGLPAPVGTTLIFGILRKELALVMLRQALQTTNVAAVLSAAQMLTFTIFVVFYVPCLATLAALNRELGWRKMLAVAALTLVIALVVALVVRGALSLLLIFG
jgi:ferrous iron transport protein B